MLGFTTLSSNASFLSVSLLLAQLTTTHIDNGDRVVSPKYLPKGYNINVEVSDGNRIITSTILKANTFMNPYFIIPRGGADILATSAVGGILEIEYMKELL